MGKRLANALISKIWLDNPTFKKGVLLRSFFFTVKGEQMDRYPRNYIDDMDIQRNPVTTSITYLYKYELKNWEKNNKHIQ